ncbi:unnamed protein product [Larinioides sclopetarius]|uniref:Uncharacterized protein n=1 Tax=Larinioides sclopetarius TaxID=280406 RepID=A0AAV1ZK84_9ARAC
MTLKTRIGTSSKLLLGLKSPSDNHDRMLRIVIERIPTRGWRNFVPKDPCVF